MTDLQNIEELKRACADVVKTAEADPKYGEYYKEWGPRLLDFLRYVRDADEETRESVEFQRRIWEENPVARAGQGNISVDTAIQDAGFRKWLAGKSLSPLPQDADGRVEALEQLLDELLDEVGKYTKRTPRLKIYRVLAGFFPSDFTTVSDEGKLFELHGAMFGNRNGSGPACQRNILSRLGEALGDRGDDLPDIVNRMRLPWMLFEYYVAQSVEVPTESKTGIPSEEKLAPLPAARRRRGLSGMTGGLQAVLNILEFCRDGVSREDLKSHFKTISPTLKDSSIAIRINVLIGEYNCLKWNRDQYILTDRGHALLESGDPAELMDWLITRILGVDLAFVILRDEGSCPMLEMASRLKRVNPGWTTDWTPTTIIKELRAFGMLDPDEKDVLSLTDAGREWADRIHWKPEVLVKEEAPDVPPDLSEVKVETVEPPVAMPGFPEILREVSQSGHFPEPLVRRLDGGIWANKRRHFAVLTGLSGSGKTLLARSYGRAIAGKADGRDSQLCTIPVQPGWYDPTALLGYVNPLQGESYLRTPFLEFLLEAADSPARPFTVVLDEMNLSRPEQYLAPILSAMETGAPLNLHREGDIFDGIPSTIRYPSNLAIIGTVNMDETTHGISDKVLDRAFTIEFWDIDLASYPRWGQRDLSDENEKFARGLLEKLMDSLKPARMHFGWRVVDDVLDYMSRVIAHGGVNDPAVMLDSVVYAKILPKLRGDDSPRFREALDSCLKILEERGLTDCHKKVKELKDDLEATGSARFWR